MIRLARCLALASVALLAALPARAAVAIQEVTSPGGITAWLVEEPSIPFIALELRFRGGANLDAPGKRGATHLMTALLEEGAGDLDAQAFQRATEALAADFGFDAYGDAIGISARFLTENAGAAVDLLRSAIVQPRFDEAAIERVRRQVLAMIAADAKDPGKIANAAFDALAWGEHPYGSQIEGTLDSVLALERADLLAAHAATLARDRVFVGVVGDISAAELGPMLDRLLGDLPAEGAPQLGPARLLLKGGVTLVPFDTPQSVAMFGHGGIDEDDPDFFAAFVLNHILGGGGFGSRLMEEVREKRGLTYGIGTYLASMDHGNLILGQVATANARMAETVAVIRAEWRRLAEGDVSEAELEAAKRFITGAYPLRFDGNANIARILAGMQMNDRPLDYIATRNDRIEAVTLDDLKRVAARLLRPEDLRFVVVGQPEGLDATE
jgi:zinc protease